MAKNYVFLIHGIDEFSVGWMQQESTAATGLRKAVHQYPLFQNQLRDEGVEIVPAFYDDVFQRIWSVAQRQIGGCPYRKSQGVSISRLQSVTWSIVLLTAQQTARVFSTTPGPTSLMHPAGMPKMKGALDIPISTEILGVLGQGALIAIFEAGVSQGLKDRIRQALVKDTRWSELGRYRDDQPAEIMQIQLHYLAFILVGVYFLALLCIRHGIERSW
ncbi:hypothetical protein E4634_16125 [Mangrovimicrobium sediminis]|uniref:Uncharacterized protein n=1 Tax=Mangrovimicrobium sediminis TaxID=2562682 RepID=A0A4Z0LXU0_9GAMM|nr:hypothetical protein [Haliea sp. SAOS-164]TGD72193.1 hypothetical protein E4634_16125 [Haliea sp. SAOS-164]